MISCEEHRDDSILYNIPATVVSVFCIGEPSSRVDSGCAREISIPYAVFISF